MRALGQGGLVWKILGSRYFVCNLYFPNRASLVVTLGKAPLSGDYAVDLDLRPQVLQHDALIGVCLTLDINFKTPKSRLQKQLL